MADTTLPGLLATGDHASRPAANAVGSGALYSCTTHGLVYQSDGSAWTTWATLGGGAVAAGDVSFTPAGTIAATDVQAAIEEVASEASGGGGGGSSLLETLLANAVSGDPGLDAVETTGSAAGDMVALGFFASHNSSTRLSATAATYTVPAGRTLLILQAYCSSGDTSFKRVYLRNTTDSTDVMNNNSFATHGNGNPMVGMYEGDGVGDWNRKVGAGKTIVMQVDVPDTVRRMMGGIVIGVLV